MVKPQSEDFSSSRVKSSKNRVSTLKRKFTAMMLILGIWMTGSQNEVGESLNLDVGSYLLNLGSTMYFGTLKFIYSEKATKFCEIFTSLLSTVYLQTKVRGRFCKICGLLRIYELYNKISTYTRNLRVISRFGKK